VPETSRNVRVFGFTSLLNDTASEMAYWVLPAFLTRLGAGPEQLGLIEGIAESVASFAKLYSGNLADKLQRRKPMVVAGYAVANFAKPLLAIVSSWWQVLLIRFSDRLAKGVRGAPRDVLIAESVSTENIGSAFGLLQAMDSAGAILGPLSALLLLRYGFDLRHVFLFAAIPGMLAIIVVTLFARETKKQDAGGRTQEAGGRADLRSAQDKELSSRAKPAVAGESRDLGSQSLDHAIAKSHNLPRSFYFVLAALAIFSIGNSSDMFLVLRAQNVGIAASFAPLLGLAFNIVYTATSWPAGKLADKMSKNALAAAGFLVFGIVYLVFAFDPSRLAVWIAMGFYGLYYSLTQPVLKALVSNTVAPEHRGRAFGMFYFVTSVAALFASLLTGWLWKQFSPATPFYLSAALALVAAVILFFVPRGAKTSST
jgi:Dipeptide/tripeptide permease